MTLLSALVDLVLPRRCVACASTAGPLCPGCMPRPPALRAADGVWAAAVYENAVRAALLRYKERGRRDLAGPLAELLARAVLAATAVERAPPAGAVLVPVPSSPAAAAARGGDHVLRLARRAGAVCGVRVVPHALRLDRAVSDSAGLAVAARQANVAGAMRAAAAPPGRGAVIVDDIVTTGATLRESARALSAAGWPVLGCAVVAATPRRIVAPLAEPRGTV